MIRRLEQKDKGNWAKLYNDYANFYKVPMNTVILDVNSNIVNYEKF